MTELDLTAVIPVKILDDSTYALASKIREAIDNKVKIIVVVNNKNATVRREMFTSLSKISKTNLKVIQSGNESPGNARNLGLEKCTTHYITFWDADDIPLVSEVCRLTTAIQNQPGATIGVGSFRIEDAQSGKVLSVNICSDRRRLESYLMINPGIWRWVFSIKRLENTRFQSFSMGEDQDFLADVNPKLEEILYTEEVTYIYKKGWKNQLTQSSESIDQIADSIAYMMLKASDKSGNRWRFKLLCRQFVTGLKRGSWRTKIRILMMLPRLVVISVS
jgi:glycosyltransferase involved in cell wall biosynthesis